MFDLFKKEPEPNKPRYPKLLRDTVLAFMEILYKVDSRDSNELKLFREKYAHVKDFDRVAKGLIRVMFGDPPSEKPGLHT